jgi:xylulose-5-phosphate/fructose-6-phosphate phosphoketolase
MPGEVIDRPNPKPLPSSVPESVLSLAVKLEKLQINDNDLQALQDFRRASNYIAAG